jgi:ABC-type dipeptide/oligopeptide/nickel transport system permease component
MAAYVSRRLLQAIPLLFIISAIVFVLTSEMGDPLSAFGGGRKALRSEDRARLTRQLGPRSAVDAVRVAGRQRLAESRLRQ